MNIIAQLATMLLMQAFSKSPAGSRIMTGIGTAREANSLWNQFKPETVGV